MVVLTLPMQQRQGSFETGSFVVPADAIGEVRVTVDIATADYDTPGLTLFYRLYKFDPGLGVWRLYVGGSWLSGHVVDPELGVNPAPAISTTLDLLRGATVRAEIDIPVRMRVGCTVETLP